MREIMLIKHRLIWNISRLCMELKRKSKKSINGVVARTAFYLLSVKDVQHKREPQSDSPSVVRKHTPFSTHVLYYILRKNASKNSNLITYPNGYLILYL